MLPPVVMLSLTLIRISDADRISAEQRFLDNAELIAGLVESAVGAHASMIRSFAADQDQLVPLATHFDGVIEITNQSDASLPTASQQGWHLGNLYNIEEGVSARVPLTISLPDSNSEIKMAADAAAFTRNIDLSTNENSAMLIAVVDGNGRVVARSVQQERFLGRPVPTWEALVAVGADTGLFDAETLEGEMITFGFSKVRNTDGWAVVIGVPKAVFQARWQEPLIVLSIGVVITVFATIALSSWIASLIVAPVTGLVQCSAPMPYCATKPSVTNWLPRGSLNWPRCRPRRAAPRKCSSNARASSQSAINATARWSKSAHSPPGAVMLTEQRSN